MNRIPAKDSQVYRVGRQLLIVVGIFASVFVALGIAIAVNRGEWTFLLVIIGIAAILVLMLQLLRLEICSDGFKYRNLSGSRDISFADISRATIEVVRSDSAPQGVGVFWIALRNGQRVKVNLRTFPVQAAAVLFTALENCGIQIEVQDAWAARQFADEVREEQAKTRRQ